MSKGLFGECQRCIPGASHYQLAIPMTLKAVNGNAKHVGASHYQLAIPMTLKAVNGNAKHVGASHYQLAIPMTLKAVNGNAKHVGASHYQLAIPMTLKAVNGNAKHVCQLVNTLSRTKLRKKGSVLECQTCLPADSHFWQDSDERSGLWLACQL